jgi:RNA-directed DNA polymerase
LKLELELKNRTYRPKHSICFAVKYPKAREIFAGNFRDRIIHHLLVNELEPKLDPKFIDQSYACRKNKGAHKATKDLKRSINKITKNRTKPSYYCQLDIKSFFCGIDKSILSKIINQKIKKVYSHQNQNDLIWLANIIIFHDPTRNYYLKGDKETLNNIPANKSLFGISKNKGLPIGNLTSQFFANLYLNELDQYIKRELKIDYYFRYADDMLLLAESKQKLKTAQKQIEHFLNNKLKLKLHPDKTKYGSIYQGIDFVGYIIKPDYSLVRNRTVNNLKTKLYHFNQGLLLISNNQIQEALPLSKPPTESEIDQILAVVNSYYGLFGQANCYNLRKNIYQKHFKKLKKYLEPVGNYQYFKLKKDE